MKYVLAPKTAYKANFETQLINPIRQPDPIRFCYGSTNQPIFRAWEKSPSFAFNVCPFKLRYPSHRNWCLTKNIRHITTFRHNAIISHTRGVSYRSALFDSFIEDGIGIHEGSSNITWTLFLNDGRTTESEMNFFLHIAATSFDN